MDGLKDGPMDGWMSRCIYVVGCIDGCILDEFTCI